MIMVTQEKMSRKQEITPIPCTPLNPTCLLKPPPPESGFLSRYLSNPAVIYPLYFFGLVMYVTTNIF